MPDCLFCRIVNKELPSQVVYENDQVLIIKDIQPVAPVHWLAIPKIHIENVRDPKLLEGNLLNSIFTGIQEVTKEAGIKENGFRVVMNYGRDAEELILHLHVHIMAGRHLSWPPG